MDADEPLRAWQPLPQLFKRNARRIGGKDCVRLHVWLDAGEDFPFEVEDFRHGLDDQVRACHALALEVGDQPIERVTNSSAVVTTDFSIKLCSALYCTRDRLGLGIAEADDK